MRIIVTLLLLWLGTLGYAQGENIRPRNQRIEAFNSTQGFHQNTINAITADSKGYLWIATPNGLVRYDGYSFKYYYQNIEEPNSLPNSYISNLLSDSEGRLWVGTNNGLCIYLADQEQFMPIKENFRNEIFIKEDSQKRIWVCDGSNITIYDASSDDLEDVRRIAEINLELALNGEVITDFEFLSDSELLVVSALEIIKVNVNESDNYSVVNSSIQYEPNISRITKLVKVDNSIWVGTESGLYHTFLENNRLITLGSYFNADEEGVEKKSEILSFYIDQQEKLWIGTKQNGVFIYDPQSADFTYFKYDPKNENGLTSNRINCFYEDTFSVVWIGTAQGGLNKIDKNQKAFQNYYHNPYDVHSLSSNLITDITEDSEGRIWISFFEGSICRTEEELNISTAQEVKFERFEKQLSKLSSEWTLRIFQDKKGYWWIGTSKGLYFYDETTDKLKKVNLINKKEPASTIFMRVINQIDADQIILGGSEIFVLNDPWSKILNDIPVDVDQQVFDLGKDNYVNDYVKDSFGDYWFATTKGVYIVASDKGKWSVKKHLTTEPDEDGLALSNNRVFATKNASNGDIWLGTFGGGLMKVELDNFGNPVKIKNYHRKDGLRDEAIYGIIEDDDGQLWISTDMGISCFNPSNETFRFYDVNDGVSSNNFRQSAYLQTKNGIILMGGVHGLTIFDPKQILNNEIAPQILISKLKINNQPVVSGSKFDNKIILENSITNTDKITVDYANRNISLDIIVQHSATPRKNKIAYKLEGINKDWIEIDGGETTATYTNLSSGTYNFLYKGSNGDDLWTKNTETFIIQVLAPWYARRWSIAFSIILALLIAYAFFRYIVRVEKLNQKLKFEQLDKERVYDMNQAKLRFFTNVSHDFKTPLSLIIGPLEKIAEENYDLKNQKYFIIIKNNIARLHRLIDQLVSYRKSESGHLELKYSKTTLGNFIYPIIEEFEDYAQRSLLNFYYKVDEPNKTIYIDVDTTERIVLNLFSNAVKYSDSNREVSIEAGFSIENNIESLFIKVTNVGIGIPSDKIDKIFDRFYRGVDDKSDWQGTGIGLALCKSLIDLMKGDISVTSDPGKKTTFRISLPIEEKGQQIIDSEISNKNKISTDWLPSELDIIQHHSQDTSRPTILVVDDEQDIRSFLQEAFINNYNVILAVDGEDGLKKMKEGSPQLVISDVMMPKLNGYQLCEQIKNSPEFCHIPVILLTANDDTVKKIEGLELGADDYIIKPFSIKYLEVRVKKLIENKQRVFEYYSSNSVMPKDSLVNSIRDKEFLKDLNTSIEKNMSNSAFGVEELASDIHMSTSNLYRRLKELTGQVPNLYLRNFRLQRAAQLLRADKSLTAAQVMYEIGIESKSYYSSSFKKIHGVSPSEFIKKNRSL